MMIKKKRIIKCFFIGISKVALNKFTTTTDHDHYLPHIPVYKESSAITKIRPILDVSAKEK